MIAGITCIKGHYCEGTNDKFPGSATKIQIKSTPCPAGTYGAPANSQSSAACLPCDEGKYCDTPGQLVTGGDCAAGFICLTGNDRPGPYVTDYSAAPA